MSAAARVRAAYAAIEAAGRPEIWITLRPLAEALAEAEAIDARTAAGEALVLAGLVVAVKDNIDVAGLPTTAAAPSYEYLPARDATCVARLRAAGAVVLGKTNLDQFATGLVGTRSPYGAVRNAWHPARISGGSSSGSAVAVALGLADFALGTDTAGSGRVPAALNGIVGVKPTRGVIPCTGVVPACRSLDCVTVFARSLPLARQAVSVMAGPDGVDPLATLLGSSPRGGWLLRDTRHGGAPGTRDGADAGQARIAVPLPSQLAGLADGWAAAFESAVARLRARGAEIITVDIAPLLDAATLLYGGSFVAERYTAVGRHIREHAGLIGGDLDPVVATIILGAEKHGAADYFADRERLDRLAASAARALDGCDALLTPTTALHPTIAEVHADPVGLNARLGTYTNFANLLDLAALAVPVGTVAGLPFGIMLTGPAGSDASLAEIAITAGLPDTAGLPAIAATAGRAELAELPGAATTAEFPRAAELRAITASGHAEPAPLPKAAVRSDGPDVEVLVIGAHLGGQPLNHELIAAGGTLIGQAATAPAYRLYALDTQPPKPGLVRVGPLPAADSEPVPLPGSRPVIIAGPGPVPVPDSRPVLTADSGPVTVAGSRPLPAVDSESRTAADSGLRPAGDAGTSIPGEVWRLPAAGFARFMAGLAAPMAIGRVALDDGRDVLGFLCEPMAVHGATDITSYGGWRAWLGRDALGRDDPGGPA